MATYARTNTSGLSWTNTSAWTPTGAPTTAADAATFTSVITAANSTTAATATVGQIEVTNPSAAITIAASASQIITISPAASFSNIGIKFTGSTGGNLTIAAEVTLASSQEWQVASGRTLSITGRINANTRNVTISGAGTTSLGNTGNLTTWTNSVITVSGGLLTATDNRAYGASTNSVVVNSGGALNVPGAQTLGPTSFQVAGQGASGLLAGAIYFVSSAAFDSARTVTLLGASPTILLNAGTNNGTIAGTPTSGDITFNMVGQGIGTTTLPNLQSFTVPANQYLVLRGAVPTTGAAAQADFGLSGSDANSFGNAGNRVRVQSSLRLTNRGAAALAVTLSRNYFFEGESGSGVPVTPNFYSIAPISSAGSSMTFTGTIDGTTGNWVKTDSIAGSTPHILQFGSPAGGKLNGSWNLRSFSNLNNIYLHPNLDISTWSGALWVSTISYGVAPVGAATYDSNAVIDNISGAALTLAHSSYTVGSALTFTGSSPMSLGSGNVTASSSLTVTVSANTFTIPGNVSVTANLVKTGSGTLQLSGNNTVPTSVSLSAGSLILNSSGSAGGTGAQFIFVAGTELDSTTGANLNQTGNINTGSVGGSWTWKGTNNLTFGSGSVTTGGNRTITFAAGGQLGTLKFSGAIATSVLGTIWEFGGAIAGAKQRVTLGGANASLANATATNQHAVTAGYFRIENNDGLGASGATTTWWVGATNAGVQTVGAKAALELAGVTTPNNKNIKLYNIGPTDDGALIGASGTSVFSGNIEVPNVAGTRIGVKTGATLTLLGSDIYPNLNPANANTPLSFTAESGGTLNQNRILGGPTQVGSNVGAITVTGGTGTVVFSRANLHTGAMTCSAGTTKLTHANAAGATSGNNVTVSSGATMEVTVKAVFPATLTLGNSPTTAATFKVSV